MQERGKRRYSYLALAPWPTQDKQGIFWVYNIIARPLPITNHIIHKLRENVTVPSESTTPLPAQCVITRTSSATEKVGLYFDDNTVWPKILAGIIIGESML